jgi:hypothetical protein
MAIPPERYAAFQQGVEYGAREAVKEAFAQMKRESGVLIERRHVLRLTEFALKRVKKKLKK